MDIEDKSDSSLAALDNLEKVIERLRAIRAANPDSEVFIAALDSAGAAEDNGAQQLVVADNANPLTLLIVAQLALGMVQDLVVEFVKRQPEAVIQAGLLGAAARAANSILEQSTGTRIDSRDRRIVSKTRVDSEDNIGTPVGRA